MQPFDALVAGAALLEPELARAGFRFEFRDADRSSGGDFAWGEFVRGDRRLELDFQWSLGLVTYHIGELWLEHESYLRALGVPAGRNQYPGFSEDPLDAFRHLAHDLRAFCPEFLTGDAAVLRRAALAELAPRRAEQRALNAKALGEERTRAEAHALFRAGEYERVVRLLGRLRYPELLSASECGMLEIARRRAGGLTLQ